jgi:2-polyprenyl-3-methyl-5-hydroxy-6-metoxy-1,4-benzoquinol methylase
LRFQIVPRYSSLYYKKVGASAERSAREIVPLVVDLLEPRTVVDVGCGLGDWLVVFEELGVDAVLGIDGDWVPRDSLRIDSSRFLAHTLTEPLVMTRQFDLVVCLEVAEHLPATIAPSFIDLDSLGAGGHVLGGGAISARYRPPE